MENTFEITEFYIITYHCHDEKNDVDCDIVSNDKNSCFRLDNRNASSNESCRKSGTLKIPNTLLFELIRILPVIATGTTHISNQKSKFTC